MLWQHQGVEEATWEREDTMHVNYPFLFDGEGFLVINVLNDCCICMCLNVYICV